MQWDVRHIERNAKKFNEDGTPICRSAAIVTETILRVIRSASQKYFYFTKIVVFLLLFTSSGA